MKWLLVLLMVGSLHAFDSLEFDKRTCNVVGAGTKGKQFFFRGKKTQAGCQSILSTSKFSKKYRSCSIAYFSYDKNRDNFSSCNFGYTDGNVRKSQVYFSQKGNVGCRFTCD